MQNNMTCLPGSTYTYTRTCKISLGNFIAKNYIKAYKFISKLMGRTDILLIDGNNTIILDGSGSIVFKISSNTQLIDFMFMVNNEK